MRRLLLLLALAGIASAQAESNAGYSRGQIHPDFRLPRLDGSFGKLSDFRGKKVLLINFASW